MTSNSKASTMNSDKRYLDYNATTPLADEVVSVIQTSLINDWGNPSSSHTYGLQAKRTIANARKSIAEMLNRPSSEIIFTSGGTEANNMIIFGALQYFEEFKEYTKAKDTGKPHIITTNVEHDSVLLPIAHLQKRSLATYTAVEVNEKGCVDVEELLSKITDSTCLITVMYANNETGVIMPIAEIGRRLFQINVERENQKLIKILFHTDAAQIIGKEKVDAQGLEVDYMTVVGHKFYGPRIGCVWSRAPLFPLLYGGGQENNIRPGTENTPMIAGLGKAAELVALNIDKYQRHMLSCKDRLESRLKEIFGNDIVINCCESQRLPNTTNVSFVGEGLEGKTILNHCKNLIASVGAACHGSECSKILINSGVPVALAKNAIRLSVGRDTSFDDIEIVVNDLRQAVEKIKSQSQ